MTFNIKSKKPSISGIAQHTRLVHAYLEQEAQNVYGSSYNQLSIKEQKEISMRIAKKYKYSLTSVD